MSAARISTLRTRLSTIEATITSILSTGWVELEHNDIRQRKLELADLQEMEQKIQEELADLTGESLGEGRQMQIMVPHL